MDPVQTYTPLAIIAVAVTLLIQLLKSDKIPITIPPRFQPLAAVVFSLIAMIATRIAQGLPVGRAVFEGLLAAMGAVGIFEASSSITKPPSDPPAPKPPTSALPPEGPYRQSGDGALRVAISMLFALVAFGCSSVAVVDGAVTAANLAAKGERMATPILDKLCAEPMTALALEPPSAERRKAFDDLTAHCDPLEGAYRQVHADREILVDLIHAATSEEGATVGDIIAATEKLTKSIGDLAALVEEMGK